MSNALPPQASANTGFPVDVRGLGFRNGMSAQKCPRVAGPNGSLLVVMARLIGPATIMKHLPCLGGPSDRFEDSDAG